MPSIGIIGAGITGLCTALAIARTHCHDVTLYERRSNITDRTTDQGLLLPPNATKVLRALGIQEGLLQQAAQPQAQIMRELKLGFQLSELPLGALVQARYGAHYLTHRQSNLAQLLLGSLPATVKQQPNHNCTAAEPATGTLQFADQQSTQHDLVVLTGAQQCAQLIRESHGDPPPAAPAPMQSKGYWRGISQVDTNTSSALGHHVTDWFGPDRWLRHWPLPQPQCHAFTLVDAALPFDADITKATGWPPLLTQLLAAAVQPSHHQYPEQTVAPDWIHGRIVAVGNAAHLLPPFSDQDLALNIEDAWVLSRMLEQQEQDPAAAAAEYQRYRLRRAQRVERYAVDAGRNYQLNQRGQRWLRNLKLSLGSRFLPEMALARSDWLYGYDCIRGFH